MKNKLKKRWQSTMNLRSMYEDQETQSTEVCWMISRKRWSATVIQCRAGTGRVRIQSSHKESNPNTQKAHWLQGRSQAMTSSTAIVTPSTYCPCSSPTWNKPAACWNELVALASYLRILFSSRNLGTFASMPPSPPPSFLAPTLLPTAEWHSMTLFSNRA